jgi:hypothetical protein
MGSPSTCLDLHFPFLALLRCAKKSLSLLLGQTTYIYLSIYIYIYTYIYIYIYIYIYGQGMWRVWGRGEVCTGFWWGNLRERDHWGDLDADGRIILRWIFRKWDVGCELDRAG